MSEPRCTTRLIRWARCSSTSWPTFAEYERAKGRLKGRKPKLTAKQQKELRGTGDYTISDLAELFKVFRPTVYRTLQSQKSTPPTQ